jgi:hypothetical protein
MQTQGRLPLQPRWEDLDRRAGGVLWLRGETGSYSRRAAGFAPNFPHFLGGARPLWEVRTHAECSVRESVIDQFNRIVLYPYSGYVWGFRNSGRRCRV